MSARSTAAVDSRSSHSAIGSAVSCARLRAKARVDWARGAFRAVHIDRQTEHDSGGAALGGEVEDAAGVEAETLARHGFDRSSHAAVRIARGNADRLGAEIEADQRATIRQQCGGVDESENRHGVRLACGIGEGDFSAPVHAIIMRLCKR